MRSFLILVFFIFQLSAQVFINKPAIQVGLRERFPVPTGFKRVHQAPDAFGGWLRKMPIWKKDMPVLDYMGQIYKKSGNRQVAAVAACKTAGRSMDQCMDILMRFYAAYLQKENRLDELVLPLPDGTPYSYSAAQMGQFPFFRGLHFYLAPDGNAGLNLNAYLRRIFALTSTQAFYFHYKKIDMDALQPGDFIVKKGRKGHAVLIVDVVVDRRGNRRALIGQGDTPACGFYFLKDKNGSPWFRISAEDTYPLLPISKKMYWQGLRRF